MSTKNAEHARNWRKNRPDRYKKSAAKQAARVRAMRRLAQLHPEDFDRLYAQELLRG